MLSETLTEELGAYRIGDKIRALRQAKGLGLAQLGAHSGLSAGMLSKIETGASVPTLPTLMRIALVFGVGLEHFFSDSDAPLIEIVRAADRLKMPVRDGERTAYVFESLDFPVKKRAFETYVAEFVEAAEPSPPHSHPGAECIYVMHGALELSLHGRRHRLEAGDAVHFDASHPHAYRRASRGACTAVVIASSAVPGSSEQS